MGKKNIGVIHIPGFVRKYSGNAEQMKPKRIYLIGLDGFNAALFRGLEKTGVMPNLSRLMKEGVFGPLRSTVPPYTGPAWVSMFTGVNPGRHGIFSFTRRTPGGYGQSLLTSADIAVPPIWDLLGSRGLTSGVFNVPVTYPPRPLNGFMVTGMLTPSRESEFTYPAGLKAVLGDNYRIDVPLNLEKDWGNTRVIDRLEEELTEKCRALDSLLQKHDPAFLMAVFVLPDRVQHLWRKFLSPSDERPETGFAREVRERVFGLFGRLDEEIGSLAGRLDSDDVILIASDHGFASFQKTFYLNVLLAREGFLKLRKSGEGIMRFFRFFNMYGIKKHLPAFLINSARMRSGPALIDWSRSRAFASTSMGEGIFINLKGREPQGQVSPGEEYERIREELRRKLLQLTVPGGDGPLLADLARREDIYQGERLSSAPDLFLLFRKAGWNMSAGLTGRDIWKDWSKFPFGVHHPEGIWSAAGGGISAHPEPIPARIEDIAPTILSLFQLPLPENLDGKSIAILSASSESLPAEDNLRSVLPAGAGLSAGEEDRIKERLSGLGYL